MFDFSRFLRSRFRKPAEVVALLRAYGATDLPQEAAVAKWFQRKAVPADWFAVLLTYLELDEGAPISLSVYLTNRG